MSDESFQDRIWRKADMPPSPPSGERSRESLHTASSIDRPAKRTDTVREDNDGRFKDAMSSTISVGDVIKVVGLALSIGAAVWIIKSDVRDLSTKMTYKFEAQDTAFSGLKEKMNEQERLRKMDFLDTTEKTKDLQTDVQKIKNALIARGILKGE